MSLKESKTRTNADRVKFFGPEKALSLLLITISAILHPDIRKADEERHFGKVEAATRLLYAALHERLPNR
jgi:hypothetical protein